MGWHLRETGGHVDVTQSKESYPRLFALLLSVIAGSLTVSETKMTGEHGTEHLV